MSEFLQRIDFLFSLFCICLLGLLFLIWCFRVALFGYGDVFKRAKRSNSPLIHRFLFGYWFFVIDPVANLFIKLKISPNMITLTSLLGFLLAGILFGMGAYGSAGWIMIFAGTLDILDGIVARQTKRVTLSGNFLDSTLDRFAEVFVFGAIIYTSDNKLLSLCALLAMSGSLLVSYTRAKGESCGVSYSGGIMQRGERIFYLGIVAAFMPVMFRLFNNFFNDNYKLPLIVILSFIALFSWQTAVNRLIWIFNQLKASEYNQKEGSPAEI